MRIKVCGIRNREDAFTSIEAGVDALGFLVGVTHLAEDKIEPLEARRIISVLPRSVMAVAVTHLTDPSGIVGVVRSTGAAAVQVQAEIGLEAIAALRRLLPRHRILKCVHVTGREAVGQAVRYAPWADALVLDSRTADRLGGTGLTHDWHISREIVKAVSKPVVLAGGLNPENIREAIATVLPYAVDANSGLENPEGYKDLSKVRRFVRRARAEARATPWGIAT